MGLNEITDIKHHVKLIAEDERNSSFIIIIVNKKDLKIRNIIISC